MLLDIMPMGTTVGTIALDVRHCARVRRGLHIYWRGKRIIFWSCW
jgi:hypothetical protein